MTSIRNDYKKIALGLTNPYNFDKAYQLQNIYLQWLPLLAHYNQSSCCNEMPQKDQLQWAAHLYICPVSEIICTKIRVKGLGSLLVHRKFPVQCGEFHC